MIYLFIKLLRSLIILIYIFIHSIMNRFSFAFSLTTNQIFKMGCPQFCKPQASSSAILSTAIYIMENMPKLLPPNLSKLQQILQIGDLTTALAHYCNPYYESWVNYINECLLQNRAIFYQNTLYMQIPLNIVQQVSINDLSENGLIQQKWNQQQNLSPRDRVSKIFGLPQIPPKYKKICLFQNNQIEQDKFAPKINQIGLFLGNLFNNQQWHVFQIVKGQIPTIPQLVSYDAVILTGSSLSVLSLTPQIQIAMANLFQAYQINKHLKILGVCFGHQLISHFFGAKLKKKERKVGLQVINLDRSIIEAHPFFSPLLNLEYCRMSEHHEDFVEQVPAGFQLVAKSGSCKVECLLSDDARILTTQFHSEFFCKYDMIHQKRLNHYFHTGNLKLFYMPDSLQNQSENVQHSKLFLSVFRKLIDY